MQRSATHSVGIPARQCGKKTMSSLHFFKPVILRLDRRISAESNPFLMRQKSLRRCLRSAKYPSSRGVEKAT